ncbi:MAG: hypothetical protein KGI97_04635, partial [Alphaproteobacteria bacterium]|nr:hypothetical protein [Alphaproteobacteria bacterium]
AHALFLASAMALAVFWELRVAIFMELFMLAPLAWLLGAIWAKLRRHLWGRELFWAEIAAFALLGPIPVLFLPALTHATPFYPDILFFPAARPTPIRDLSPVIAVLNDPKILGAKPRAIMNVSNTGPELMLFTRDNVVAGNFDVPGNIDAFAFFNAKTAAPALAAARKWGADLVLVSDPAPRIYLGKNYYSLSHAKLEPGKDGKLRLVNTQKEQPLIARLIRGDIPRWLKPIEIPGHSDYLLFEIKNPAGRKE